jgi:nucleoside-diphosphate-sugar epimerase
MPLLVIQFFLFSFLLLQQNQHISFVDADDATAKADDAEKKDINGLQLQQQELNENSIVLITGAASQLGSQLALSLFYTYNVSKLILIDDFESNSLYNHDDNIGFGVDSGGNILFDWDQQRHDATQFFTQDDNNNDNDQLNQEQKQSQHENKMKQQQEAMTSFECKRQRIFHVLQSIVSSTNGGSERVVFYKADVRPSVPQFLDYSKFPILNYIFNHLHQGNNNNDDNNAKKKITHVVHLESVTAATTTATTTHHHHHHHEKIIPRIKDDTQYGLMDGLLEQLRVQKELNGVDNVPQFIYASTSDIYNNSTTATHMPMANDDPLHGIFMENWNITTTNNENSKIINNMPSTTLGMSKLMDEMLAGYYNRLHGIYSIGLRFFHVYGPWSNPSSIVYEMAEHSIACSISSEGNYEDGEDHCKSIPLSPSSSKDELLHNMQDFVYIDDAIDAVLSAMQFRPMTKRLPSFIINVGTGQGSTIANISQIMEDYFVGSNFFEQNNDNEYETAGSGGVLFKKVVASMDRAKTLFGYQPLTSLKEGITRTLAWHYDRLHPFGSGKLNILEQYNHVDYNNSNINTNNIDKEDQGNNPIKAIQNAGMQSCSPLDKECLQGITIFPCSSDCCNDEKCIPSIYDSIITVSREITKKCDDVMYTVDLSIELVSIPSSTTMNQHSHLTGRHCNIAFINENSGLMLRLKNLNSIPRATIVGDELVHQLSEGFNGGRYLLNHGFWTILPISAPTINDIELQKLKLLPKLSPRYFFSTKTSYALYCDSNVIFQNAPSLLHVLKSQPSAAGLAGDTIMMFGMKSRRSNADYLNSAVQTKAYNSIKMSFGSKLGITSDYFLDTSWTIHSLPSADARTLRCEIYGEMMRWNTIDDSDSTEFVLFLNHIWGSAISKWNNVLNKWWLDKSKHVNEKFDFQESQSGTLFDPNQIRTNNGNWIAIPYAEQMSYVRLLPSEFAGIQKSCHKIRKNDEVFNVESGSCS